MLRRKGRRCVFLVVGMMLVAPFVGAQEAKQSPTGSGQSEREAMYYRYLEFPSYVKGVVYQATHEMARTPLAPDFPDHARADRPQSERIQRLLEAVHHRGEKALEEFWSEVSELGTPLVEPIPGDDKHLLVTFLWHGGDETRNVVIFSGVTIMWSFTRGDLIDHAMERLPGTDVWFRSYTLPRDARFAYYLSPNDFLVPSAELNEPKDYESRAATWQHDPLNPRREARPHADKDWVVSLVELPDAPPKPWLNYQAQEKGSIVEHTITSKVLGGERRMWIYLPPRYGEGSDPYPLVVNFDGNRFGASKAVEILDYLIGEGKSSPLVAVWVEQKDRWVELGCSENWNRFVVSEVMPWVRANYRVTSDPQRTVVRGESLGGLAALFLGLRHSETFGNVSSSSAFVVAPSCGFIMREFVTSSKLPLRFYLDVGLFERDEDNLLFANRHLQDVLLAKGYEVHYAEFAGGHDQTHTDIGWADGLQTLLPKHAAASARSIDLQPVRLLTSDGRYEDAEPAPSPDGKHVIFARVDVERKGRWRLWIVATSGGPPRALTPPDFDWDCTRPSWSRDGHWIAFRASRAVNGSGHGGIWIMPVAEGETAARQLTFDGGRGPAWSPDGRWIAYGCPVLPRGYALCLKRVEGGPVIQVTDGSGNDFNPEWGPDDAWIAVVQGDDDAFGHIAVVDVGSITGPVTWKAGSGRIVFDSNRSGTNEIYVVEPDGSKVRQLTHTAEEGGGPAWSPDGKRIAYYLATRHASGNYVSSDIWVMNADRSGTQALTSCQSRNWYPAWSPDGQHIAFNTGKEGAWNTYETCVVNADGSNQQCLTNNDSVDAHPDWR